MAQKRQKLPGTGWKSGLPGGMRQADALRSFSPSPFGGACYLFGGGIEAVEEVGGSDHEEQGGKSLLVVVAGGFVPNRVRDRVGPVGKPGDGRSERQRGAFGIGEVGCLAPGRDGEEALIRLAGPLGAACAGVNAKATAIDLARA